MTNTVSGEHRSETPEKTVAEIEASEELSIENEGQVNVSEQTPVEAARDEGSVVERALTKTADATEDGESEPTKYEVTAIETTQDGQAPPTHDCLEDKNQGQIAEDKNTATSPSYVESEDKMDIAPETTKFARGKKRSRGGDNTEETENEIVHIEQENGNETKRAKIDAEDATTNGRTANGHTQSANGDSAEARTNEGEIPKKVVKGSSRPKVDAPQAVVAETEETIARRTRSKA